MRKVIIFLGTTGGRVVLTIAIYACTLLIMSLIGMFAEHLPQSEAVEIIFTVFSLIIVGSWTFFGWKALSVITPNIFLIMPIIGWVIYFVIKGLLSIIVGIFVGPYYMSKNISTFIQNRY